MSLARQFLREMRPFFHMLEEPFGRSPTYLPAMNRMDPFQEILGRPAIDVADKGDKYVVDADLPGVPKENVEVRIGDNGRSITIEGKVEQGEGSKAASSEGLPPGKIPINQICNTLMSI
jgi:HSP20 family protein